MVGTFGSLFWKMALVCVYDNINNMVSLPAEVVDLFMEE